MQWARDSHRSARKLSIMRGRVDVEYAVRAAKLNAMLRRLAVMAVCIGCSVRSAPAPVPPRMPQADEPLLVIRNRHEAPRPTSAPQAPMTPAQIFVQVRGSVVVIQTPHGMGSGFVVAPNRIATCFHVVAGASTILVKTLDGQVHSVDAIVGYDPRSDVAVLAVDGVALPAIPFADSSAVSPGEPVTVVGHPKALESTVSTGVVSAIRRSPSGWGLLQVTAPISPGSSGGPVLNEQGEVIGVTRFYLADGQALNFATPASELQRLLAADAAPISLAQFAHATQPTSDAESPEVADAPREHVGATRRQFPKVVAGFRLGMSLVEAKFKCATVSNQAAAKRNAPWETALEVDGTRAHCPFSADPIDFVSSVALVFTRDQLVSVGLIANSTGLAWQRLAVRYGAPDGCKVGARALAWRPGIEGQASQCHWPLDGGLVVFSRGKSTMVVYMSDREEALNANSY